MQRTARRFARPFMACAAAMSLFWGQGSARGQEEEAPPEEPAAAAPDDDKPWAQGVTEEARARALELFQNGNSYFERSQYPQALAQYREAVEVWDHPAIRYNMAVCLIHLDEPLEAHDNLTAGLKYGEAPLNSELLNEGQTYMKLLMGRLAWVTIATKEQGAAVSFDSKELFEGPGEKRILIAPGKHQLVARKEGMLTHTQDVEADAGAESRVDIKMLPLSAGVEMKRRWKTWKPWTVLGAGAGAMALGGAAYLLARSDFNTYEQRIDDRCPMGCLESDLPKSITRLETRAKVENVTAMSLLIAGGATATAGVVMVFMNRPRAVQTEKSPGVTITPAVGSDSVAVSSTFRF